MNCLAFFEATKASIKLCFKITMFSRTISIDCNFSLRLSCLFVIFNTFLNFFLKQLGFSLPIYCHSLSLFDNFFFLSFVTSPFPLISFVRAFPRKNRIHKYCDYNRNRYIFSNSFDNIFQTVSFKVFSHFIIHLNRLFS